MQFTLALAALAAVASAQPDDCAAANKLAAALSGDCMAYQACMANTGFANNGGFSSNDGYMSNGGYASNDGYSGNSGFDANEGFMGNDGASNDGFMANDGASNSGFMANDGASNSGFMANDGSANSAFLAMCDDLIACGIFEAGGDFDDCANASPITTKSSTCDEMWIGDGVCDQACNTAKYDYDSGDCETASA